MEELLVELLVLEESDVDEDCWKENPALEELCPPLPDAVVPLAENENPVVLGLLLLFPMEKPPNGLLPLAFVVWPNPELEVEDIGVAETLAATEEDEELFLLRTLTILRLDRTSLETF